MIRVLGIVPARGGSKGVPRKNIKELCGKPLLWYTAEAALRSNRLTRTILSTEDSEIAAIGKAYGLEVPFMRPMELAGDLVPTLLVVRHVLETLEGEGERYDAVCLLQPTSPLRSSDDIDACIRLLETTNADSVISVSRVPEHVNPHWVYFLGDSGELRLCTGEQEPIPRRQSLPAAFYRNGLVYVTRVTIVLGSQSLYGAHTQGFETPPDRVLNIDTLDDWAEAERRLKERG